ncbi:regulator of G-protein signaling 9-binding protein-like, partial [Plakobranchus ocellatus]
IVYSLSREVAVYCWLSMGIGAVNDSYALREDLKTSGHKLYDLVLLCKRRLVPLLLSKRLKEEEREDLERLYRIFAGCLETLQAEFVRAITLQSIFPLWDQNTHLIQTGATESVCIKKCSPIEPLDASALNRQIADFEEFQSLKKKVLTLQELSYTTSQMMDVNPWDYKPDTDHTKIDVETSEAEVEESTVVPSNNISRDHEGRSRHRKCVIWTIVLAAGLSLVLAGVLGLAFAFANEGE